MLFITDQHHMEDLEEKVVKVYGKDHSIRLMGDMSPSIISSPDKSTDTLLKRARRLVLFKEKQRGSDGEELPVQEKIRIDKLYVAECGDKEFLNELVCLYGGGPIANLARKHFIHAFSKDITICLSGNEPLMDNAQEAIYQRIMERLKIPQEKVMEFVLEQIKEKQPKMYDIIVKQLRESGVTGDISQFILAELSTKNYSGSIPTSSAVFREHPHLDRFRFVSDIYWEKAGNCAIVYIPYFNNDGERQQAMEKSSSALTKFLKSHTGHVILAYHGNPYPQGMNDDKVKRRMDYNLSLIQPLVFDIVLPTIARGHEAEMLCGHLHSSSDPYYWSVGMGRIRLRPLGIRDITFLDINNGKMEIQRY